MATLVLTAVGTAIGGPIGGAIGALIGQQVDNAVFAPKARQGPRLGDLAVQTSSYGTQIPKIFGTLRAAGTVIWATDLKESKSTSGGGKGKPKVTSYSYSASFAVALSGRPIRDVRRIWADGKLLRGAAGDFKSRTKFRLYKGGEDQAPDPFIASREGIGATPAFRGVAYAMFEDFQLADYGNRIPSLTFEIVADDGEVAIGTMAAELSGGIVRGGETPFLGGYAVSGDSVRGALEPLFDLMPLSLAEDGEGLLLRAPGEAPILLAQAECGAENRRTEISRRAPGLTPGAVSLAHHDPARDYQTGLQRATRNVPGAPDEARALPASLPAAAARGLAEYRLKALWAARETARASIGWRRGMLSPGGLVQLEGQPGLWAIARTTLEKMVQTLELRRVGGGTPQAMAAESGRPTREPDTAVGETVLVLADLPLGDGEARSRPLLTVAACGTASAWRQADLIVSYDGGARWEAAGSTAGPATIGRVTTPPGPGGGSAMIDLTASIEVELLNEGMWLESCDDQALAGGENLALIGQELIQFGKAEPLGGTRFRLSRLLRGRRGTEWANLHAAGEPFLLVERDNLLFLEPSAGLLGASATLAGQGIGDGGDGVEATCLVTGEALRPPSPVHLNLTWDGGDAVLTWARRSRTGWFWIDGGDAPLGEERELYEVRIWGAGFNRSIQTSEPVYRYGASDRAADGNPAGINVEIVQIGTLLRSRPASAAFEI
ncbi:MAG TPA: phage tail protein [Allosphingosinicella sp.]